MRSAGTSRRSSIKEREERLDGERMSVAKLSPQTTDSAEKPFFSNAC
jgi:hypothetical protein